MRVRLTERAVTDLREIADWIAADNPPAALKLLRALRHRCRQLGEHPRAYPLVPRYESRGIRRRPFGNYLIFYRIAVHHVEILHILHGARDCEPLLFPDQ